MEQSYISKYQPLYFKDFETEEKELFPLLNTLISMDNLNVLLIGDNGSGKTSIMNAIIKEYYKDHPKSMDNVLFINNLKEQGINYYRTEVKTFCQTGSSIKERKKIVMLDDLDTINEQSQQVFRNCIDKYRHNVCFIASCYNTQKVIESLQSRFNIIKLKLLHKHSMLKILKRIKKIEGLTIDDDAEDFILNVSNKSVKVLLNYLEKFKLLGEHVTIDVATNICTNICFYTYIEYTRTCIYDKDIVKAIKILYDIYDKGYSVMDILDNYFLFIKTTDMIEEDTKYKIIELLCKYMTIFYNIHEEEIELALFTNNLVKLFD